MRLRSACQPGFLVPALLALWLVADVGLRALPRDLVSYRVWEAMRTFGAATPFRPNARYDRVVYGNLSVLGNQPDLREYRRVVFTTDSLGYHNPPGGRGRPDAILFGSSFSAGAEVNDWEMAASLLGVFNAAPEPPSPARVRELGARLVIFEYLEGTEPPPIAVVLPDPRALRCRAALGSLDGRATCGVFTWVRDRWDVSPLEVFSDRLHRRLENDVLLPNVAAARVLRVRLGTGGELLFPADQRGTYARERSPERALRYFTWLASHLARDGRTLFVVLTPEKYGVYAPLMGDTPDGASPGYLAALEAGLRARGIGVVNLTEPLRVAAREALRDGRTIFWRDDTHWNPAGNAAAARAIEEALPKP